MPDSIVLCLCHSLANCCERSACHLARLDECQNCAHFVFRNLTVKVCLEVKPDFGRPLKISVESQGGVGGNGALAFDNFIDAARRNADILGKPIFRQAKRKQKVLAENLSGVDGGVFFHGVRKKGFQW